MNLWRLRVLTKLAQQASTTTTTTQQGAAPTATPEGSMQASPNVTGFMTTLNVGWGSQVNNIASLVAQLDKAIVAGTRGKYNFKSLYDMNFQGYESSYTSPVSDVLFLSKKVFAQFLNNKNDFRAPLAPADMKQRASIVANAPEISKFTQINPASDLGKKGVSLSSVQDTVKLILNSIPTQ